MKGAQLYPTLLRLQGLYSPWNSPGHNTGVGSLSLLQGIFQTQGSNPGLPHCRWILYRLSHKASPRILEWVAYPFSRDLPDPEIKPGSPALQEDSLPTELSGKPPVRLQCGRPGFDPWGGKIPWTRDRLPTPVFLGFPCGTAGKESAGNEGDPGSIPG